MEFLMYCLLRHLVHIPMLCQFFVCFRTWCFLPSSIAVPGFYVIVKLSLFQAGKDIDR